MRGARVWTLLLCPILLWGETRTEHPFAGLTHITRMETSPRNVTIHVVQIELTTPGIRFKLTPQGGARETIRQTTLAFLREQKAQVAINAHFFLPFPSDDREAFLVGLAASDGNTYSAFETPAQSYAIVADAPALNIDASNHASIVHRDPKFADGRHVVENVTLWNAVSGSAQIVTDGVKTIPTYIDGGLTPGGPQPYSSADSWYERVNARTAIGLSHDGRVLTLLTVDRMTVGEVADLLISGYGVYNALNLDGGGSTSLAIQDPITKVGALANVSSDDPAGRAVGSNLAIWAGVQAAR
jgi:exopolysaccharide biosynthesis protein